MMNLGSPVEKSGNYPLYQGRKREGKQTHHVDGVHRSNAVDVHGCFNHRRPHWNTTEDILTQTTSSFVQVC